MSTPGSDKLLAWLLEKPIKLESGGNMNKIRVFWLAFLVILPSLTLIPSVSAAQLRVQTLTNIIPITCTTPATVTSFQPNDPQATLYFVLDNCNSGDQVVAQWQRPDSTTYSTSSWNALSSAGSFCFWSWMWIANNPPASIPGMWSVRVSVNGSFLFSSNFTIAGQAQNNDTPYINELNRSQVTPGSINVTLSGSGFQAGASVTVKYAPNGNAQFVVGTVPAQVNSNSQMIVGLFLRDPGEFQLTVQNPNGRTSNSKILYVGLGGYKLPYPSGETWSSKQGNNGSVSHYGKLAYAYDLSAGPNHCVAAMRSGRVTTNDRGLGQTTSASYGNYITIDHGNGEYSHYAHLTTGTFAVQNGQYVEQGQPLATVGNSGYAFSQTPGDGGGYHAHVHVTLSSDINAQSVPFLFDDVNGHDPAGPPPGQVVQGGSYLSQNYSAISCQSGSGQNKDDRAKQDMLKLASQLGYYNPNYSSFGKDLTSDPYWEIRWMYFSCNQYNLFYYSPWIEVITSKSDPNNRLITYQACGGLWIGYWLNP